MTMPYEHYDDWSGRFSGVFHLTNWNEILTGYESFLYFRREAKANIRFYINRIKDGYRYGYIQEDGRGAYSEDTETDLEQAKVHALEFFKEHYVSRLNDFLCRKIELHKKEIEQEIIVPTFPICENPNIEIKELSEKSRFYIKGNSNE
jgi:hypothetical protein